MNRSRFWKLLGVEILLVLCAGAYFLIDSHDVYRWWVGDTHFVTAPQTCSLHQSACDVRLEDGHDIAFEVSPKPIPLMKPLQFRATIKHIDLPFVELKIFATNMNMGFHTFKLYAKGDGIYEGEGMLPTCVVGNMIWQTNLIINMPSQSLGATFYFQTDK